MARTLGVDDFWDRYGSWQKTLREYYIRHAEDKALAEIQSRAVLNNADLLNSLPWNDRQDIIEAFRTRVLGFDDIFEPSMFDPIGAPYKGGTRSVGRVNTSRFADDDPRAFILRQLSIQRDTTRGSGVDQFFFGRNIPQMEFMKSQMQQLLSGDPLREGAKLFVFDTETVGLGSNLAGVREVAALNMRVQNGTLVSDAADSVQKVSFNVARSGYGTIYNQETGRYVQLDKHFRRLAGSSLMMGEAADGDAFAEGLVSMLKQMSQADHIVGQNVQFDIGQVIFNATKTAAYNQNKQIGGENFKSLVDSVIRKIERGEVIDTLVMSKQYFGNDLPIAKELAALGEKRPASLENVLLETNLAELIKRDVGNEIFSGMQHTADYDTFITGQYLKYMKSGELAAFDEHGNSLRTTDMALRRATLRSSAPTPVTHFADVRDVSYEFFERVLERDPSKLSVVRLGESDPIDVGTRSAYDWYTELTKDETEYAARFRVNALEQQVFATSRVLDSNVDYDSPGGIIDNIGNWRKFSQYDIPYRGTLNRLHTLFKRAKMPDEASYKAFQDKMAKSGMPFAGITLPERVLTGALASAGSLRSDAYAEMSPAQRSVAKYGDDLGISTFRLRDAGFDKNFVSLSPKALEEAGLGIGRGTMLSLSTIDSKQAVNLMYRLESEAQAQQLVDFLRESVEKGTGRQYGITAMNIDQVAESILEKGTTRGINVGYLDKDAGKQAYAALNDLFQGLTSDDVMPNVRVGVVDVGEKNLRVGAAVMDTYADDAARTAYQSDLEIAARRADELSTALNDSGLAQRARILYKTGMGDLARRVDEGYTAFMKRAPMVGAVGVGVLGAYYMYKKKKEQDVYDESLAPMQYQTAEDYRDYRQEMGLAPMAATRRPDPLLTAGIVGNLDRGAVGHTTMGPYKDMSLFAGI